MFRLLLCLSVIFCVGYCQVVNRVRLVGYRDYILKVIGNVMLEVEDREWCNLKLPPITQDLNETVFNDPYMGRVTYTNGFVTSIQKLDILRRSVQQVWSADGVSLQGDLQMHNVILGYDVIADLQERGVKRYTTELQHNLLTFAFRMMYNIYKDEMTVTITGNIPVRNNNVMNFLPKDTLTDVLATRFNSAWTADGIMAWGSEIFEPITYKVVPEVEFPRICYDCPVVSEV